MEATRGDRGIRQTPAFPAKIIESKERRRQRLANLSVPEKIRIIVELQKRRAPILRMRGKKQIIWLLDEDRQK